MSSQIRHATLIPHSDKYSVLSECHNDGSDMDYNYTVQPGNLLANLLNALVS